MCLGAALTTNIDAGQVAFFATTGAVIGTGLGAAALGTQALWGYLGVKLTIGTATGVATTLEADGVSTNEIGKTIKVGEQLLQNVPVNVIRFTQ
jgi:hypothetical protein